MAGTGVAEVSPVPRSTYRLQITPDFDLFEAAGRLSYLHDLGVDWVYLSPLLAAEPGSDHGYDVVAHDHVDQARGGGRGLKELADAAHGLGMGVLVDIVPNHMGVATPAENAWWWKLLRDGAEGTHAHRFDVDWPAGGGRVLVPVVGDDDLRPDGSIANLSVVDGELRYHDNRFPVAPGTEGDDAQEVHARQHYELVGWRRGDSELNYRRFFTVTTLAGIRVEDADVFADSHAEIERWFDDGLVDGLRVDHPDGLRDPEGYLTDLAGLTDDSYVLVEKILEPGEELDPAWSCAGTTGYDAMAWIDRVLVDPAGEKPLTALEERLRGRAVDFHAMVHDLKRSVAETGLLAEVRRIVREIGSTTVDPLIDAVAELLACFPVYRSYLPQGREHLDHAFADARARRPDLAAAYDALEPVLQDHEHPAALRFQQTSGMVMAKGVEDCAFYRYARLTSLNEVGGDPSLFAVSPQDLHGWAARREHEWPQAMTAGTTHDTKRSEDVRARLHVLAELPETWTAFMDRVQALAPMPDPGFASLAWQALVGAWPLDRERIHAYAEKAMREAAEHTTWTDPDEAFESAVHRALDAAYDDPQVATLVEETATTLAGPGWSNALAAKLLTLTLPGVPDVYQGSELWQQSLVDPDNRRPVDYERAAAAGTEAGAAPTVSAGLDDAGLAKLAVTRAALRLRRDRPDLFDSYAPLAAEGPAADHVLAFDRGGAVTVVTRLPVGLVDEGGWQDTALRLPDGAWIDQVSGRSFTGEVPLRDLLTDLPVVLLARSN